MVTSIFRRLHGCWTTRLLCQQLFFPGCVVGGPLGCYGNNYISQVAWLPVGEPLGCYGNKYISQVAWLVDH